MKKWKYCFAGFWLFMSSLVSTAINDSKPTSESWFSGNTIVINVTQAAK